MNYGQLLGFIIHSGVFVSFKFCFGIAYDSNMNKKGENRFIDWSSTQQNESQTRSIYSKLLFWRDYSYDLSMLYISEKIYEFKI